MNTFWGCDTTDIDRWAELGTGQAAALTALLDDIAAAGPALEWYGPDAQHFQARLSAFLLAGYEAGRQLSRFLELIRAEGKEQEEASAPAGGTGATGGNGPAGGHDGTSPSGAPVTGVPHPARPLSGPGWSNPFGPLAHPDPAGLGRVLREKIKDIDWQPPWWDPGLHHPLSGPGGGAPVPRFPEPSGATAPDISITADGQPVRSSAIGQVPVLQHLQTAMQGHEAVGEVIGWAEQGMIDAGYGRYTGALAPVKIMHASSGVVLGEDSVLGQVLGGVDAQIGNTFHTAGAVGGALQEGDVLGAAREAEMGLMRHAESQIDILTATPLRSMAGFASTSLEATADALDPIAPPAVSDSLRGSAETIDSHVEAWDEATSAQRFLDLRYRYLPTPWDQPA